MLTANTWRDWDNEADNNIHTGEAGGGARKELEVNMPLQTDPQVAMWEVVIVTGDL